MIGGWDLAAPLALLLLPLPIVIMAWRQPGSSITSGLRIPVSLRDRLAGEPGKRKAASRSVILSWVAWICLVVALADPRMVAATPALPASGRDIVFALDLSGSMIAQDMMLQGKLVTRIDALKQIGGTLIRRRAGDRVGIVVFAEHTLVATPLSFDVESVSRSLNELTIGLVGRSTAMGAGLGLAVKRLAESKAPSRIVILMSDGANNAGTQDPAGVAILAKSLGIRIFTIGLGPNDAANADDVESVDFEALQTYATLGGGASFRARTGDDLEAASHAIEALVTGETVAPPTVIRQDLWSYPGALCLLASAGAFAIRRSRRW